MRSVRCPVRRRRTGRVSVRNSPLRVGSMGTALSAPSRGRQRRAARRSIRRGDLRHACADKIANITRCCGHNRSADGCPDIRNGLVDPNDAERRANEAAKQTGNCRYRCTPTCIVLQVPQDSPGQDPEPDEQNGHEWLDHSSIMPLRVAMATASVRLAALSLVSTELTWNFTV